MPKKPASIQLSRIDFYRLRGQEFFGALFKCIEGTLGEGPQRTKRWAELSVYQQGVYAWWCFWGDVENGGLTQFFYNHTDAYIPALEKLLTISGNEAMAALLKPAMAVYRKHKKQFAIENPFGDDGLFARMTELKKMSTPVVRLINRTNKHLEKWLRANIALIAVGDSGEPIDPAFTGEIESHYPNGKVFEKATVRRGVLRGPYHRYFDDGTLEHSCYYDAGEISSDYWPNGQPKHKSMKRGKLKVDEWYFPSGKLQKRYVADKTGDAVEPIQVWHENGQLAEEIHTKGGREFGPWLKFFDDGSPRLEAEYRKNDLLVVHNAWDDQRSQIVKNGVGTYFHDGIDFAVSFDLKLDHQFTRSNELRDGIPNGAGTSWNGGVLWSKENHLNGKFDGVYTLFYDNGRVRSRTMYRNGKDGKREEFPKFDYPRPAVLIQIEADADLFTAWKHPLLDVYPTPRNLEKIQAQLPIPAFLQEVFERNLPKSIRESYEDINTFNDGIGYFVTVNERGSVESVQWTGCGVYSGGSIDVYLPFIEKLKFEPGRLHGRKVRCRVYVNVTHTFVESDVTQ